MEPRTLEQLVKAVREERLNDSASPPRWPDSFLIRSFAEAEAEAAERARLLRDTINVPLIEGQRVYLLPTTVFEVQEVRADGVTIDQYASQDLDRVDGGWRKRTSRSPRGYTVEALPSERLMLEVVETPTGIEAGASLSVVVYRRPKYALEGWGDEPEIAPRWHDRLMEWVAYRAFMHRDPDLYDPNKAETFLADFEVTFGIKRSADDIRRHREHRSNTTIAREF